jgi:hypothetical protein
MEELSERKTTGQHHDVEPNSQDRGRDLVTANNRGGIVPHDFISELDIRGLKGSCFQSERLSAAADFYRIEARET